jgi:hypothetical protein
VPIEYRYDRDKKTLYGSVTSPLTIPQLEEMLVGVTSSKDFPPDTRTLWDLRGVDFEGIDRGFEELVISVRRQYPQRGEARIALVVEDQLGLGMTRMYEILGEDLPQQTRVFTSYAEGEQWLLEA